MGHRKSHHRASKGGTPEDHLVHRKDKHDTDEYGSKGKSRREKKSHKRKRESEDASKRRHRDRHRSSHHRHRSSSKEKSRNKLHGRKHGRSSESDSSSSLLSLKAARHDRDGHCFSVDMPRKRSQSPIHDGHIENRLKRLRVDKEALSHDDSGEYFDVWKEPLRSFKPVIHERGRGEAVITKTREQEMGSEGKKDKVLEVELREKALANFMRRHDTSWRMDEHDPVDTRQPVACNEEIDKAVAEVENKGSLGMVNAVNVDASEDALCHPASRDAAAPINEKHLANDKKDNLEEGEIDSDAPIENETVSDSMSSVIIRGEENRNNVDDLHANRAACEKDRDLRESSEGDLGTSKISMALPSIGEMPELLQEPTVKAVKESSNTAAQHDGGTFQEKTMSVMRGGEMVQVSYKVYIPKRAAELAARRRLQR